MAVALVHQFGGMTSNDSILISTTLSDVPGVSMHTQAFQGPFCTKNATVLESALFCLCRSLSVSCRFPCSPAMPVSLGQRARKTIEMLKNYGCQTIRIRAPWHFSTKGFSGLCWGANHGE